MVHLVTPPQTRFEATGWLVGWFVCITMFGELFSWTAVKFGSCRYIFVGLDSESEEVCALGHTLTLIFYIQVYCSYGFKSKTC